MKPQIRSIHGPPSLNKTAQGSRYGLAGYAELEERLTAMEVTKRQLAAHPVFGKGEGLRRRDRERIARVLRDAVEALHEDAHRYLGPPQTNSKLLTLVTLVVNAQYREYDWHELTVDVCVALASQPTPRGLDIDLSKAARQLIRSARFARMPALPCNWVVTTQGLSLPQKAGLLGRMSTSRPNLQRLPRR